MLLLPDDNAVFARDRNMIMSEQLHNARRCAGRKREVADHDFSDIDGVKRVHILGGVDGKQYFFFIEMLR